MREHHIWLEYIDREALRMKCHIPMVLRDYICNLMVKASSTHDWVNPHILTEYWALQQRGAPCESWQTLGDSCLLAAGIFPEKIGSQSSMSVCFDVGRGCYRKVLDYKGHESGECFRLLIVSFQELVHLLQNMNKPYRWFGN